MKYAREVIDLMAAFPGRRFKVRQIVNHAAPRATAQQRSSVRIGVHRVLKSLELSGQVCSTRGEVEYGADGEYWWVDVTAISCSKTVTSSLAQPYQKP
ncbi:hypothetical protein vBBaMIFTN8_72 [Bordetella phage vB_BaM-IFTN8]|nr:hypothetical protein vBBaMIFTN4_67 [Bordetella phage vB_BaM-IFTN4]UOK17537.1 hypothetical protein vBBaMIFTN8_72 [Bordetella phage vB_BaM-IFTN8]